MDTLDIGQRLSGLQNVNDNLSVVEHKPGKPEIVICDFVGSLRHAMFS